MIRTITPEATGYVASLHMFEELRKALFDSKSKQAFYEGRNATLLYPFPNAKPRAFFFRSEGIFQDSPLSSNQDSGLIMWKQMGDPYLFVLEKYSEDYLIFSDAAYGIKYAILKTYSMLKEPIIHFINFSNCPEQVNDLLFHAKDDGSVHLYKEVKNENTSGN